MNVKHGHELIHKQALNFLGSASQLVSVNYVDQLLNVTESIQHEKLLGWHYSRDGFLVRFETGQSIFSKNTGINNVNLLSSSFSDTLHQSHSTSFFVLSP
ncbi:hypothetical protein [Oceaniserpentilla sp. 4NH20-0058]|uniref:hypothetical protein n=1 Tax=Oceaniserpentilla sp. 4NH20-0058 TaxID=3127660 RepID=UPI003341E7CA